MNTIDILFLVTIALLVFNGLRNGAVFSLIHLVALPVAFVGAAWFGPSLTGLLAAHHLLANPLIVYAVLFFGLALVLLAVLHGVLQGTHALPGIGPSLFQSWQQAYDSAISQSLFAHVNSAFVH